MTEHDASPTPGVASVPPGGEQPAKHLARLKVSGVPGPSAAAYAAMRGRAEKAEQLAAGQRDALAAVLDALGVPYPATVGDGEVYTEILLDRVMHARGMLAAILDPATADLAPLEWRVAYLRERLAENPAQGVVAEVYVTSHARLYDLSVGRDWRTLAEDGVDSGYESEKTSPAHRIRQGGRASRPPSSARSARKPG